MEGIIWNITCLTGISTSMDPINKVIPILKVIFIIAVLLSIILGSRRYRAWNWLNPAIKNLDAPILIIMP